MPPWLNLWCRGVWVLSCLHLLLQVGTVDVQHDGDNHRRVLPSHVRESRGGCDAPVFLRQLLGGLLTAIIVKFTTLLDGSAGELVTGAVEHKLAFVSGGAAGMANLFFRAILCNFMINIAMLLIYNGFVKSDGVKVAAMVVSVLLFAFLGFEHSVANTVLFTVEGLRNGIDVGLVALGNVGIALLGSFVGGGLLIGLYYAYANDSERHRRTHPALREE